MLTLSDATVGDFKLCDVSLLAISWVERGRDVQLLLEQPEGHVVKLTCEWASALDIELKSSSDRAGMPLSWECTFERTGQRWTMSCEFPPHGRVALQCDGAHLEPASAVER